MFTPIESTLGALLIQSATSSYMHLEGKAIGFSSILYNSVFKPSIHSVSILIGLFLSTRFIQSVLPSFAPVVVQVTSGSFPIRNLVAGLLVGFGTSAGCGCTSGHMLIGLSRMRWRSFVATCTFFLSAVITTLLTKGHSLASPSNVAGYEYDANFTNFKNYMAPLLALVVLGQVWSYIVLPKLGIWLKGSEADAKKEKNKLIDRTVRSFTGLSSGFLFGAGLSIAGMTDTAKIIGFLSFWKPSRFDPSLAMIPLFCIVPNVFLWRKWLPQTKAESAAVVTKNTKTLVKKPLFESEYELNFSNRTGFSFLLGNVIFGIGWGIAGICPGPAILTMFTELNAATFGRGLLWVAGFMGGSFLQKHVAK